MKDILFSIVIPAYNASESIVTTLDCVAAQSYQNFEVIIVDDNLLMLISWPRWCSQNVTAS